MTLTQAEAEELVLKQPGEELFWRITLLRSASTLFKVLYLYRRFLLKAIEKLVLSSAKLRLSLESFTYI